MINSSSATRNVPDIFLNLVEYLAAPLNKPDSKTSVARLPRKTRCESFPFVPAAHGQAAVILRSILSKYYARAWMVEASHSIFVQNSNSVATAKHLIWAEISMALVNRVIGR